MNLPVSTFGGLLAEYLRPQRLRVLGLAVLLFANIGLQLVNPLIMRRFLDTALAGQTDFLSQMALLFIVIALIQQAVAVAATYVSEQVGWTATNLLRYDLARHLVNLDMSFHNQHSPGELIERVDGDINALSQFFSQFVVQVVGNALLLLGILLLVGREDTLLGLALAGWVLFLFLSINRLRSVAVPHWRESRAVEANLYGFLEERLAGTEEIRASGAIAYVMRRFLLQWRDLWRTRMRATAIGFSVGMVAVILMGLIMATVFVMGGARYFEGKMTLGTVYLLVHYVTMMNQPVRRITQEMELLQKAGAGVVRIRELQAVFSRLKLAMAPVQLSGGALSIELEALSFAYQDGPEEDVEDPLRSDQETDYVLREISLAIAAGQIVGLLGRTGSGKTTLTRLLMRLYDPTLGSIRLGGVDLRAVELAHLRRRVGIVTQNVQLFHASVRDNLTFFDPAIGDAHLLAMIQELGLSRWYQQLPQGLDTLLAPGGGDLSAGEAQLLAMARIFLYDPGLVILDEASSRLDPATEHLVEAAITRLLRGRTALIIAHRLSTVQRADRIVILENGRVLEEGGRSKLAANPASRFYQLLQTGLEEVLA